MEGFFDELRLHASRLDAPDKEPSLNDRWYHRSHHPSASGWSEGTISHALAARGVEKTKTPYTTGDAPPKDVPSLAVTEPFRCPTEGCEKAYKYLNGLKYHRLVSYGRFKNVESELKNP